ncbi:hypothetical protein I552_9679 [Mycobacterium xenopi 3993]|nr:hypothetical protein I552_9679 [Mycobacterium xenopi 3993]
MQSRVSAGFPMSWRARISCASELSASIISLMLLVYSSTPGGRS